MHQVSFQCKRVRIRLAGSPLNDHYLLGEDAPHEDLEQVGRQQAIEATVEGIGTLKVSIVAKG